jgi:hypothetical protein
MVLTLSWRTSDFTAADRGNVAVPTPECPMAFRPGGSDAAVDGYGFTRGPLPSNRSNRDFKQRSPVIAAPFRGQGRGLRRGACR